MAMTPLDWMHLRKTRYGWNAQPGQQVGALNINLREVGVSTRGLRELRAGTGLSCLVDGQALNRALARATSRA